MIGSLLVVTVSNVVSGNLDVLTLVATLVGVTSLIFAAFLTMLRSSYYALGYAANDIVLIVLWILASRENPIYIPVVVNFSIFLFNDMYGFFSWKKRELKQSENFLMQRR